MKIVFCDSSSLDNGEGEGLHYYFHIQSPKSADITKYFSSQIQSVLVQKLVRTKGFYVFVYLGFFFIFKPVGEWVLNKKQSCLISDFIPGGRNGRLGRRRSSASCWRTRSGSRTGLICWHWLDSLAPV